MNSFLNAIKLAVLQGNWHAALALALTLPDVCGRIENPSKGSQDRFVDWYDRFLLHCYQANIGGRAIRFHTFLCGSDCYARRCAFLHQGEFGIDDQRAQKVLERFHFMAPRQQGLIIHKSQINDALYLQVDKFCLEVCEAVEQWLGAVAANPDIQSRLAKLALIE